MTFRTLCRDKGHTFLNIGGLAIGLAACAIIALFVRDELSYDNFHPAAERIYALNSDYAYRENLNLRLLGVPEAMGQVLVDEVPGVEMAFRWRYASLRFTDVPEPDRAESIRMTDPAFLEMTGFALIRGNPNTALDEPRSLVLTPDMARTLFGADDPIGRTLRSAEGDVYTVTGIIVAPPHNTEFQFEILAPFEETSDAWSPAGQTQTFIRLADRFSIESFSALMPSFLSTHMGEQGTRMHIAPQRLRDLHLRRERGSTADGGLYGNITYVWMFSTIAALILLIACINYTNLATARALKRAREVGVRKAVGAARGQLAWQFLGESVLVTALATVLAVALVNWGLPPFSRLVGREIAANWAGDPWLIPAFALLIPFVGLMSGLFPSVVLSRFKPVDALKGQLGLVDTRAHVRKGLVTFQFVISVGLIICTIVMLRQLEFMQDRKLGLEADQILTIIAGNDNADRFPILKSGFEQSRNVERVAGGGVLFDSYLQFFEEDVPIRPSNDVIRVMNVDHDFVQTYGIEIVAGRDFNLEMTAARGRTVLLNESAVLDMGIENPAGMLLTSSMDDEIVWEVVGVVRDFHFRSVREAIEPLVIVQEEVSHDRIAVRFGTEDVQSTLASLEEVWTEVIPGQPFTYAFLDEQFANLYVTERRTGTLFSLAAGLAILVSCLGMFGLAAFSAEQRTKEIGIRRVLGASVGRVVGMLAGDFLKLVGIAFVISAPVAWFVMKRWLDDYAYRIDMGPGIFVLAAFAALLIVFASIGWQAIRAATSDPVKALRYE